MGRERTEGLAEAPRKELVRQPRKGSIFLHASENLATGFGVRQSTCRGLGGKEENMPDACPRALQQKCLLRRVAAALMASSRDGLSDPSCTGRLLSSPPIAWAGKGTRSRERGALFSNSAQALQDSSFLEIHMWNRGTLWVLLWGEAPRGPWWHKENQAGIPGMRGEFPVTCAL